MKNLNLASNGAFLGEDFTKRPKNINISAETLQGIFDLFTCLITS